jgi:hypothetical protein
VIVATIRKRIIRVGGEAEVRGSWTRERIRVRPDPGEEGDRKRGGEVIQEPKPVCGMTTKDETRFAVRAQPRRQSQARPLASDPASTSIQFKFSPSGLAAVWPTDGPTADSVCGPNCVSVYVFAGQQCHRIIQQSAQIVTRKLQSRSGHR